MSQGNAKKGASAPENRKKNTWFKPGTSGNPGGRPKSAQISACVRARLEEGIAQEIADGWIDLALNSKGIAKARSIEAICDRMEGKAVQGFRLEPPMGEDTIRRITELATLLLDEKPVPILQADTLTNMRLGLPPALESE